MNTIYQVTSKLPNCGIFGTYETLEEAQRQCGEDQFIEKIERSGIMGKNEHGDLMDYDTGTFIRPATAEERKASDDEVAAGRHEGVIPVDWRSEGGWKGEDSRRCFVMP